MSRSKIGRGHRTVAAALGVVLVAGGAWAVNETVDDDAPQAVDCEVTEAPTLDEAAVIAQRCGHDVAAVDTYDPWSATVATPDKTVRQDVSAGAVRTDLSGEWEPVDPSVVVDSATGKLKVAAPVYDITLDPTDEDSFLSIAAGDASLSVGVPVDLGRPAVEGSLVTWPLLDAAGEEIGGAILTAIVHPDATGVTPVIEVRDRAAYAALAEAAGTDGVAFEVKVTEGIVLGKPAGTGGFEAIDEVTGETVFAGGEALQWDSSGGVEPGAEVRASPGQHGRDRAAQVGRSWQDASPAPSAGDKIRPMGLEVAAGKRTLRVTPDASMVEDPATEWPIAIDPPINGITRHEWTMVRTYHDNRYKGTGSEGVGLCDVQAASACVRDYVARMFWEFTGITTLTSLAASDIVSASFSAYGTHSYDCSGYSLQMHLMSSGISSATTWSNQPASRQYLSSQYPKHRTGQCGGPGWVEWDVTEGAKTLAGSSSTMVLGLRSPTETSMKSWRRYYLHSASLSIEYNRAPLKPYNMKAMVDATTVPCVLGTSRPVINTTTPTLMATGKDPDNQSVYVHFQVLQAGQEVWYGVQGWQASGATHQQRIPAGVLQNGSTYTYRATAKDAGGRWSGWGAYCEFTVDTVKPGAPGIAAQEPDGAGSEIEAVYMPDVERGGIGQMGCFRITPGVPSDVKVYRFSFNATTHDESAVPTTGGSGVACDEPSAAGTNFLSVLAEDAAGNRSSVTRYYFRVATAREDGIWTFDTRTNPVPDQSSKEAGEAERAGDLDVFGASWLTGPHTYFRSRTGDYALNFDGSNDYAATRAPVFDTDVSFVISAHVYLDTATTRRAALSQDGARESAWKVGYQPSGCTTGPGGCWTFTLTGPDGQAHTVHSSEAALPGRWVNLTAEYNQGASQARLWVCDAGTLTDPAPGEPVPQAISLPSAPAEASGVVALGRAQVAGSPAEWWDGRIDNVRLFKGEVVAAAKIRRICQGAEANDFGVDQAALDPTTAVQR